MTQKEPLKLILEIDGQKLSRPELTSKDKTGEEPFFFYYYKYITFQDAEYYNWYPEIYRAA
jgi:hypothetical protein